MARNFIRALCALFFILICLACSSSSYVESVSPAGWSDALIFDWENKDSLKRKDISIILRYRKSETDSVLKLRIASIAPSSLSIIEQIELRLSPKAKQDWGASEILEQLYRQNVQFKELGDYQFKIYPTEEETGIEAVGIKFEEIK